MKWNKIRHFTFIKEDKNLWMKNLIVWKEKVHPSQPQRIKFWKNTIITHSVMWKVNHNSLNPIWTS